MNLVLELPLRPVPKLVLVTLADNADDYGRCWPSIPNISRRASVSERTVQRVIAWLASEKIIAVNRRFRRDGSQSSNEFIIFPNSEGMEPDLPGCDKLTPSAGGNAKRDATPTSLTAVPVVTPLTDKESLSESLQQQETAPNQPLVIPSCFSDGQRIAITGVLVGLSLVLQQQLLDEVDENYRLHPEKTVPLRLLRFLADAARRGIFRPELCFIAQKRRDAFFERSKSQNKPFTKPIKEKSEEKMAALRGAIKKPKVEEHPQGLSKGGNK